MSLTPKDNNRCDIQRKSDNILKELLKKDKSPSTSQLNKKITPSKTTSSRGQFITSHKSPTHNNAYTAATPD